MVLRIAKVNTTLLMWHDSIDVPLFYIKKIIMQRLNEIKELFDKLCNTNLSVEDHIPELSTEDKLNLIKCINDAKAEAQRLRILDIMRKVCS